MKHIHGQARSLYIASIWWVEGGGWKRAKLPKIHERSVLHERGLYEEKGGGAER